MSFFIEKGDRLPVIGLEGGKTFVFCERPTTPSTLKDGEVVIMGIEGEAAKKTI